MRSFVPVVFLIFAAGEIAAVEVGASWEFDKERETAGWTTASDLEGLEAGDGRLKAIVTGDGARISGPDLNIAAESGIGIKLAHTQRG